MLTSFVERDGMARTVLIMLGMTTIACLSYTWGYSEVSLIRYTFLAHMGVHLLPCLHRLSAKVGKGKIP